MLAKAGADVNQLNLDGRAALHLAAKGGALLVDILVAMNKPTMSTSETRTGALHPLRGAGGPLLHRNPREKISLMSMLRR